MMKKKDINQNWKKAAWDVFGKDIKFLGPDEGEISEQTLPGQSVLGHYFCYDDVAMKGNYKGLEFTFIRNIQIAHFRWQLVDSPVRRSTCSTLIHQLIIHNKTHLPQRIICDAVMSDLRVAETGEQWKNNDRINGYRVFSQKQELNKEEIIRIGLMTSWMRNVPGFYYPSNFGDIIYFGYVDTVLLCTVNHLQPNIQLSDQEIFITLRNALDLLSLWDWNKEV